VSARYLTARGVRVVEVNRPNRQNRRRRGKSDTVDAEAAARAVLSGEAIDTARIECTNAGNHPIGWVVRMTANEHRRPAVEQVREHVVRRPRTDPNAIIPSRQSVNAELQPVATAPSRSRSALPRSPCSYGHGAMPSGPRERAATFS
jgi:hypothetical protein